MPRGTPHRGLHHDALVRAAAPLQRLRPSLGHIFPQDEYPFPRQAVLDRWAAEIADPATRVYVCTDDVGDITGFAALREDELLHFGTALRTWGTGRARDLHDALVAEFPSTVTCCRLRVFAENRRARRFYERGSGGRPRAA